jgi:hypothetical protein
MDVAVLVHLVEQVVSEVIWAERALSTHLHSGFSGLIAPLSWTVSLATHPKHVQPLGALSLVKLVNCMKSILGQLSDGLPGLCLIVEGSELRF